MGGGPRLGVPHGIQSSELSRFPEIEKNQQNTPMEFKLLGISQPVLFSGVCFYFFKKCFVLFNWLNRRRSLRNNSRDFQREDGKDTFQ